MQRLLESVPNFSEGRRPKVVQDIVEAAQSVEGVHVLDLHSDADHNRSVLTLAGEADALVEAVFRAMERATESIDLRQHSGEHPRVGATDVVPFIPLGTTSMSEAVAAARSLGERVSQTLNIPVYFYEEAATRPERQNLEAIRRQGFEELRDAIGQDPERDPDLGPAQIHPSAGAVVVGARGPLIAYNIYLNSSDVRIAKVIAKAIRHSSGGLRYVKALGLEIPARGQVQVSMNLTNYRKSAIHTVFELVRAMADSYGASITDSEVVGLVPMEALVDSARHFLRMHDFASDQILESKLLEG
jgi:glutamate formiminotransferase/formiminotetrahydrofolate cyclodeaminase